jgi:GAF domain-containing protein
MLARGHALKVGQVGIVGYVTSSGQPRIALDVGGDAVYFDNPDLPLTRSEMALPLKVRERIIGALDVQSTEVNAFTQEDVETLSILADQVAIAIENARLLEETQQALSEIQAVYGESISRAWERKTARNPLGYQYSVAGGRPLREPIEREESRLALEVGRIQHSAGEDGPASLAVPIRLRDQVIGVVNIRANEGNRQWKEDDIAIVEATVERLALALENARLFEETSGRAAREHAVADITSKIRQTNDPQAMIRTAIQELQRVLGVTRVEIVPQSVPTNPEDKRSTG